MALALAEAGADIILVQRDGSDTATRDEIRRTTSSSASIHVADLGDREAVKQIVPALAWGRQLDILVNCAGIQRRHAAEAFPDEDWDEFCQPTWTPVFTFSREFGAHLLGRAANASGRRGAIINVASLLSFQGGITVAAYAAAKGGVAQLTKALSNEWASRGIAVNAIAPGYVETAMNEALLQDPERAAGILTRIPAGRWGRADDFKGAVVFLASDASAYVSGEVLCVDGGWMGR
ncbi:hypothetical protein UREG_07048 [Uncinocarpus reesii 1704]|uniref:2-deoxy-D-gluconate 3-dehydrogenase n=1 Tax=Uncinocarpus reesii (strain UAMH 1704) TaxID=336963 RepID=C4JXZ7_UNCRE|nr:uncharacterized protein UREG_07048 [Uncinocarpus reesii 1704]EEP82183.1 hypothetical protein UREG_07048 [Uncinocarpus reesii 1704]